MFAKTTEARLRGYEVGRFSFNVKGGRCEACQGQGVKTVEMHFLPDVQVTCEVCQGKRYNRETLEVTYRGKTIADILEMTIEDAVSLLRKPTPRSCAWPNACAMLAWGISPWVSRPPPFRAESRSGEIGSRTRTPQQCRTHAVRAGRAHHGPAFCGCGTTAQCAVRWLADTDASLIVIEHNLDVIRCADWVIDLGPEGGSGGGTIVGQGVPEEGRK